MVYRFVQVQELVHYRTIVHMVGDCAEAVILRYGGKIMFAIILPQGLVVPHDTFPHIATVQPGLVH